MRSLISSVVMAMGLVTCVAAQEGSWPQKPVKMLVPYAAGSGAADAIGRLVAEALRKQWKQTVVVENVPGASGSIGMARLSREAPDGYTIALAGDAPISVNVHLQKGIGYDPVKDLRPIFRIGKAPNLLVVHPEKGPKTLAELIAIAREKPGTLSFRSTGTGTSQHIALELLKSRATIDILHVPGGGPAAPDIMGGHVTGSFMNFPAALPQVKAGTLRALAQTGLTRASSAPDIPTLVELGFPDFEAAPWFGLFAPKDTPDSVIAAIEQAMTNAMSEPELRAKLVAIGLELDQPGTSGQFADFVAAEIPRMAEILRSARMLQQP